MAEIFKKTKKKQKKHKKNKCYVELPILAQPILLGSDVLDYSINLFIILSITSTLEDFMDKNHVYQV